MQAKPEILKNLLRPLDRDLGLCGDQDLDLDLGIDLDLDLDLDCAFRGGGEGDGEYLIQSEHITSNWKKKVK